MVSLSCHGELGRGCRVAGKRMCLTGCAKVFTTQKREMDGAGGEERTWMRSWWLREFSWAACVEDVGRFCEFSWSKER